MIINIPVYKQVDLLIFGTDTGAVAAALAARQAGKNVLCVTSFTYPGEDVCAFMNYWGWGESGETPALAPDLFGRDFFSREKPAPMQVKLRLEQEMIAAGVEFLYMAHPFRCLRDDNGQVAGAVIADRCGFQAIKAKVIIDATERSGFARKLKEAAFYPFTPGKYRLQRKVACRQTDQKIKIDGTTLPGEFQTEANRLSLFDCETDLFISTPEPGAVAKADVESRLNSWHPEQLMSSERTEFHFEDRLRTAGHHQAEWKGSADFDPAACRCGDAPVFVLGTMSDISDSVAEVLHDPCAQTALGWKVGKEAVETADSLDTGKGLQVDNWGLSATPDLDVVRHDNWFRLADYPSLEMELDYMPILGEYDVVAAGGGTAGAPAGIAAARAGARTLIVEYLPGLGGMGTEGRIASYYWGNRCGFTSEVDRGVKLETPADELEKLRETRWNTEVKKHWFLKTARQAGAEIWFNAMTVAAATDKNGATVNGLVVGTPYGCGLIKAKKVVDASGNADVAAAAGVETRAITTDHLAVQGTGLSRYVPGIHYANSDHTFIDDNDLIDVTRAFAVARRKFHNEFDITRIVESRERRQIKGELTLEPLDILAGRTFPDTIVTARSNFDSHGFTIHPVFLAKPPDKEGLWAHVPFRCLLPRDMEGVLVTGLGVSSHRDSLPVIRMQADVQNQGYSAGYAAAMAALNKCGLRQLNIRNLQQHLVEKEILKPEVLNHQDSFPLSEDDFVEAVRNGTEDYLGLAIIFSDPEQSRPLLRKAYAEAATPEWKLRCAHILGLLEDDFGIDTLVEQLNERDWDEGWNFKGMGQFGFSMSEIDSMLAAAAKSGNPKAQPVILEKLKKLSPTSEFSHCRAVSLALQVQPIPQAVEALKDLLEQLRGNSLNDLAAALKQVPSDHCDNSERNRELKELVIARSLLYCGDHFGLAKRVLNEYANDLHGHYARHARWLLANYGS